MRPSVQIGPDDSEMAFHFDVRPIVVHSLWPLVLLQAAPPRATETGPIEKADAIQVLLYPDTRMTVVLLLVVGHRFVRIQRAKRAAVLGRNNTRQRRSSRAF